MRKIPRPPWWRRRRTDPAESAEYVAQLTADQRAAAEARREIDASALPSRAELDAERATRCLHGNPLTQWCPACWASAKATAAAPNVCGETAEHCVCAEPAGHDTTAGMTEGTPHACGSPSCAGQWMGSLGDDTFEVVRLSMFGVGQMAVLRAMLAEDTGTDEDDEVVSSGTLPTMDGGAWAAGPDPLPARVPPVIYDALENGEYRGTRP